MVFARRLAGVLTAPGGGPVRQWSQCPGLSAGDGGTRALLGLHHWVIVFILLFRDSHRELAAWLWLFLREAFQAVVSPSSMGQVGS